MNAGICIYDLPPHVQKHEIEVARIELLKRLKLFRLTFLLNQLPATDAELLQRGVTPGAEVAGAYQPERIA